MSIFPTKILVATDGSREATLATHSAAQLAHETYSELHIIYVRPRSVPLHPGHFLGPEVAEQRLQREQELLEQKAQRILDVQVKEIGAAGGSVAQTHLGIGKPAEEIVALGEELGAGLIVVGSRGRGGLRRALIGSVSDSVVRHAYCPVLVVRREKNQGE
jgi:nucleotide-binding universal stress UspA family protein